MQDSHDAILARVKAEVAKIRYQDEGRDPLLTASEELDALKATTAAATEEILNIAESVLGHIEDLRGLMLPDAAMTLLAGMEGNLGRLFEACGFQDLTGQRSTKVSKLLQSLDGRVERVLDLLDHVEVPDEIAIQVQDEKVEGELALLNGPQMSGAGLGQADIDSLFN
jgi:chemotaxis protein CheZ